MSRRSTKFYRKNEAEVMYDLGLTPTKNSGAGWIEKEDGQNEHIIAQLKSTDKQSMSIKKKDIEILEYNAQIAHKIPIFVIQFLETDDIFIMVRPGHLPNISQYLNCGSIGVKSKIVEELLEVQEKLEQLQPKKVIKSSEVSKEEFWKEREEKWQKSKQKR